MFIILAWDILYKNNVILENGKYIIIEPRIYYTIENKQNDLIGEVDDIELLF